MVSLGKHSTEIRSIAVCLLATLKRKHKSNFGVKTISLSSCVVSMPFAISSESFIHMWMWSFIDYSRSIWWAVDSSDHKYISDNYDQSLSVSWMANTVWWRMANMILIVIVALAVSRTTALQVTNQFYVTQVLCVFKIWIAVRSSLPFHFCAVLPVRQLRWWSRSL